VPDLLSRQLEAAITALTSAVLDDDMDRIAHHRLEVARLRELIDARNGVAVSDERAPSVG